MALMRLLLPIQHSDYRGEHYKREDGDKKQFGLQLVLLAE